MSDKLTCPRRSSIVGVQSCWVRLTNASVPSSDCALAQPLPALPRGCSVRRRNVDIWLAIVRMLGALYRGFMSRNPTLRCRFGCAISSSIA
ncbi:hypothetical protein BAUCODRAFT_261101 [Baudoinia panamericana UAMH 10762]|uniref:Uncharacterized protein n=1 Tax=Baudoinia panamericana (strain UAMH 10762) TaxID=717646 RepID=M2LFC9_BAUPA|nr:uncharacterized protein BAUCODRAFT_261101 [Baudoinia panamericana UAMH 10762]EMC92742.1 hypothetical protein BAUCODRAFT_261101 [Baudoinia panamericana UAMH 10762]